MLSSSSDPSTLSKALALATGDLGEVDLRREPVLLVELATPEDFPDTKIKNMYLISRRGRHQISPLHKKKQKKIKKKKSGREKIIQMTRSTLKHSVYFPRTGGVGVTKHQWKADAVTKSSQGMDFWLYICGP